MALQAVARQERRDLGFEELRVRVPRERLRRAPMGASREVPLDLFGRQRATVDRDQMKRSQPGPIVRRLIGQDQGEAVIPVRELAGDLSLGLSFAVDVDSRGARRGARVNEMCYGGPDGAGRGGRRWQTVFVGLSGPQAHVVSLAVLAEREVAVTRAGGKRDDSRRPGLPYQAWLEPRFDRQAARALDRINDFSRGSGRMDLRGRVHNQRAVAPSNRGRLVDLQIEWSTDAGTVVDRIAATGVEGVQCLQVPSNARHIRGVRDDRR